MVIRKGNKRFVSRCDGISHLNYNYSDRENSSTPQSHSSPRSNSLPRGLKNDLAAWRGYFFETQRQKRFCRVRN